MAISFFSPEFLIPTVIPNAQFQSDVTGLADGRFVVVWRDESGTDGDPGTAIRARIFNADGTPAGAQFRVNTTTTNSQYRPEVTALQDGGFAVIWTDASMTPPDTSGEALRLQIYGPNGAPVGTERLVPQVTTDTQSYSDITTLSDGRIVAVWEDYSATSGDTAGAAIKARILNADGTPSGNEFLVNTITTDDQYDPRITAMSNGGFFVVWQDNSASAGDTDGSAIRGQIFDATGAKVGPERLINTTTTANQRLPDVVALDDGRVLIAWEDGSATPPDTIGLAIRAQILNADGTPSGAEFLMNTTTDFSQDNVRLVSLPGGGFMALWVDSSHLLGDASGNSVVAQAFNADGSKNGPEVLVNTITNLSQNEISATRMADGRTMVSWTDTSGSPDDPSGTYTVRGRILDARTAAVNLTGTALADHWFGTAFNDTMAGGAGNDTLRGEGGNDLLGGGAGSDSLIGGAGNDYYIIDAPSDSVVETLNNGNDTVSSSTMSLNLALYTHVEAAQLSGTGNLNVTGSARNDLLRGNSGANRLNGGNGEDRLEGRDGNDIYELNSAGDRIIELANQGIDRIESANLSVNLASFANVEGVTFRGTAALNATGTAAANTLIGNAGNNRLSGLGGADTLNGGSGNDRLDGGAGSDRMIGGAGNDRFVVDRAGDRIVETAGGGIDLLVTAAISIDVANYRNVENVDITGDRDLRITGSSAGNKLDGNAGENLLQGLAGNDLLTGRIGNDRLFGGRGADTLRGGDGADKLIGGRGKDVMTGGAGADDFVFLADNDSTTGTQADRITDFRSRIDDLDFREIAAGGQFIGNAAFTGQAGQVRYSTSGGRVQADLDGDGAADFVIVLENLPTLRAIDFLF